MGENHLQILHILCDSRLLCDFNVDHKSDQSNHELLELSGMSGMLCYVIVGPGQGQSRVLFVGFKSDDGNIIVIGQDRKSVV